MGHQFLQTHLILNNVTTKFNGRSSLLILIKQEGREHANLAKENMWWS
jgi:hypothetical protein